MGIHNVVNASLKEKMAQTLEEENQIWSTKIWEASQRKSSQAMSHTGQADDSF